MSATARDAAPSREGAGVKIPTLLLPFYFPIGRTQVCWQGSPRDVVTNGQAPTMTGKCGQQIDLRKKKSKTKQTKREKPEWGPFPKLHRHSVDKQQPAFVKEVFKHSSELNKSGL